MRKLTAILVFIFLASILITGGSPKKYSCDIVKKSVEELPKLNITIGGHKIEYIAEKNIWDGIKYDRLGTFQILMNRRPEYKIPYIKIGENTSISFKDNPPDKFTVLDILLDDKGNYQYSDKGITNIPIELENGKCSFEIKKNIMSALDSNHGKEKTIIRGYLMTASWGENRCEYAFIIETEPF